MHVPLSVCGTYFFRIPTKVLSLELSLSAAWLLEPPRDEFGAGVADRDDSADGRPDAGADWAGEAGVDLLEKREDMIADKRSREEREIEVRCLHRNRSFC